HEGIRDDAFSLEERPQRYAGVRPARGCHGCLWHGGQSREIEGTGMIDLAREGKLRGESARGPDSRNLGERCAREETDALDVGHIASTGQIPRRGGEGKSI